MRGRKEREREKDAVSREMDAVWTTPSCSDEPTFLGSPIIVSRIVAIYPRGSGKFDVLTQWFSIAFVIFKDRFDKHFIDKNNRLRTIANEKGISKINKILEIIVTYLYTYDNWYMIYYLWEMIGNF